MMKFALLAAMACLAVTSASADARDWRVSVTCDADERAATVRMMNCDANAPDGEASCFWRETNVEAGVRSVSTITNAGTELFTPYRAKPSFLSFLGAHPSEFGCVMPAGEGPELAEDDPKPALFLRIERIPTTFNWGGKCGTAPDQVALIVQHGTAALNMDMPATRIEMAGYCGWGDPLPITEVTINADTGEITQRAYDADVDLLKAAAEETPSDDDSYVSNIVPSRPEPTKDTPKSSEVEIDRNVPISTR